MGSFWWLITLVSVVGCAIVWWDHHNRAKRILARREALEKLREEVADADKDYYNYLGDSILVSNKYRDILQRHGIDPISTHTVTQDVRSGRLVASDGTPVTELHPRGTETPSGAFTSSPDSA